MTGFRKFRNPDTFFGRFVCHFALGFSACLVAQAVLLMLGRLDVYLGAIWSFGFSLLFGLIRAVLAKPGTPFWSSPLTQPEKSQTR